MNNIKISKSQIILLALTLTFFSSCANNFDKNIEKYKSTGKNKFLLKAESQAITDSNKKVLERIALSKSSNNEKLVNVNFKVVNSSLNPSTETETTRLFGLSETLKSVVIFPKATAVVSMNDVVDQLDFQHSVTIEFKLSIKRKHVNTGRITGEKFETVTKEVVIGDLQQPQTFSLDFGKVVTGWSSSFHSSNAYELSGSPKLSYKIKVN